jgi:hypothetical protein
MEALAAGVECLKILGDEGDALDSACVSSRGDAGDSTENGVAGVTTAITVAGGQSASELDPMPVVQAGRTTNGARQREAMGGDICIIHDGVLHRVLVCTMGAAEGEQKLLMDVAEAEEVLRHLVHRDGGRGVVRVAGGAPQAPVGAGLLGLTGHEHEALKHAISGQVADESRVATGDLGTESSHLLVVGYMMSETLRLVLDGVSDVGDQDRRRAAASKGAVMGLLDLMEVLASDILSLANELVARADGGVEARRQLGAVEKGGGIGLDWNGGMRKGRGRGSRTTKVSGSHLALVVVHARSERSRVPWRRARLKPTSREKRERERGMGRGCGKERTGALHTRAHMHTSGGRRARPSPRLLRLLTQDRLRCAACP